MDLTMLDAVAPDHFILGDTPLPNADLAQGFTVPLSKSLAVRARKRTGAWRRPDRGVATGMEVQEIHQAQFDQSLDVVIGPDPGVLDGLS
jgi:hypothetical protein